MLVPTRRPANTGVPAWRNIGCPLNPKRAAIADSVVDELSVWGVNANWAFLRDAMFYIEVLIEQRAIDSLENRFLWLEINPLG